MGEWVIFDYGGVLCTDQPAADRAAIERAAGVVDAERFWARYWELRRPYDQGLLDAAGYWTELLERPLDAGTIAGLDRFDVASFSHPYAGTVRLLAELAGTTGLALLSNCPPSMAAVIETLGWADLVPHRFYSCRLGLLKPDPAIYRAVLADLGADPAQTTFVDDRPANVAGAAAVGLRALLFTDPATLAADLHVQGDT